MSEWQPIETAPKTPHAKVLGWCVFGVPGRPEAEVRIITRDWRGAWYAFDCAQKATHWMPLPKPPSVNPADTDTRG